MPLPKSKYAENRYAFKMNTSMPLSRYAFMVVDVSQRRIYKTASGAQRPICLMAFLNSSKVQYKRNEKAVRTSLQSP